MAGALLMMPMSCWDANLEPVAEAGNAETLRVGMLGMQGVEFPSGCPDAGDAGYAGDAGDA